MQPDAAGMQAEKAPKQGGKVRLLTLQDLDARTRACKHALDLRDGILSNLGGQDRTSVAQRELAQRSAILGSMLEDVEARWLRGEPAELTDYCTLVNAQRRCLSDLGLQPQPRTVVPSVDQYLQHVHREAPRP